MVLGPGGLRLLPGIGGGRGRPSLDEQDRSRLVNWRGIWEERRPSSCSIVRPVLGACLRVYPLG